MPRASTDDGVELHYEERGSGPLVVFASYWSFHPSVFGPVTEELVPDHRVIRYDERGTGQSASVGPYDMETGARDLAAVIEAAGSRAVVTCTADGTNRAIRTLVSRPDLIEAIVSVGGVPLGRDKFAELDVLSASDGVVEALLAQVETDYKGTLRSLLGATNEQMSEEELRERIDAQVEHVPQDVAGPRLRVWAHDQPLEYGLAAGDRLWVLVSESMAGGWFPAGRQMAEVVERELPQAHVVEVADGWVSRPDETAGVVRRITAQAGVPARD
jgi:pimeloyl-ACP methyl ester carboxylesterase